jgi:hypothetical protein
MHFTFLERRTYLIICEYYNHSRSISPTWSFHRFRDCIHYRYGNYQFGRDVAQLGLQISEKYGNHSQKARTAFYYYTFMSTFNNHIEKDIIPLRAAYDDAVLSGDAMFARYIPVRVAVAMYFSGMPLDQVMKEAWDSSVKIRK